MRQGKAENSVAAHVSGFLVTRLHLVQDASAILKSDGKIERPLIVTGMPRTDDWLYELLALDPNARAPLEWKSIDLAGAGSRDF